MEGIARAATAVAMGRFSRTLRLLHVGWVYVAFVVDEHDFIAM